MIGGYESDYLADLVAYYLFEKFKALLNRTIYHGIYQGDGLVVFKGKKSVKEIKAWVEELQQTVNKAAGNQHLQFTAEIWAPEVYPPLPAKEDRVQIVTNDEIPFLDMKIIWSPEEDLKFRVFRKKVKQLKYIG